MAKLQTYSVDQLLRLLAEHYYTRHYGSSALTEKALENRKQLKLETEKVLLEAGLL